MNQDDFKAGAEWAMQGPGANLLDPAARVATLAFIKRGGSRRVRVRHLEGDLVDFEEVVPAGRLVCPWQDWPKVLKDEERHLRLIRHVEAVGQPDKVTCDAANCVLAASGEDIYIDEPGGYTRVHKPDALERVAERIKFQDCFWTTSPSFKDRHGKVYAPNRELVEFAVAFAQAEPHSVHVYLDLEKEEYLRMGFEPGYRHYHKLLIEYQPRWVIARHWAGGDQGHMLYTVEIDRLRNLVHEAIRRLEEANFVKEARKLERALVGR